jgi:ferrous iron transport protein A
MFPLGLLNSGEKAEIMEIRGQRCYHLCHCDQSGCRNKPYRVEDMGIRVGKSVQMLSNGGRGPLLLMVDESRIAVGRSMAMKIMVRRQG